MLVVMRNRASHSVTAALAAGLLILGGCRFKGGPAATTRPTTTQPTQSAAWQPRPVRLRIYPATRIVREQGRLLLKAQLQCFDQMGDPIKAVGAVQFELFASDHGGTTLGRRLYRWQARLDTLEQQKLYYDPVTATYVFRLHVQDAGIVGRPLVLRATMTPAHAADRLTAERVVGTGVGNR